MNNSKRIYGFWHIATLGQWQTIVESQLATIIGSELYDASHTIFVNILGVNSLSDVPQVLKRGKFAATWGPNVAHFEYPTLEILQRRSRQEDFYGWYIHVKGATSSLGDSRSPAWCWREYMEYFVLKNWRACVACLADHDTVGVEWKTTPHPHYSGNFWWADARYLRQLPDIEELKRAARGNRVSAEFWIGSGRPRAKCLHNFSRDLYLVPVQRAEYAEYADPGVVQAHARKHEASRDEILRYVRQAGSDSLTVFGGMYEGGYCLQQVPEELTDLICEVLAMGKRFVNYLEIGAAAGGTGRLLDDFLGFAAVYVVDDNKHPRAPLRRHNLPRAIECVGDSHSDACRRQLEDWNVRFDLVFVDGDHGYEGVKQDTELTLSFANEGCLFVFHDFLIYDGVARWTSELREGRIPALQHRSSVGKRLGLDVFQYLGVEKSCESSAHPTFKVGQGGRSPRKSAVERVRERIATAGRQEAIAKHTYRHRMETVLDQVRRSLSQSSSVGGGISNAAPREESAFFEFPVTDLLSVVSTSAQRVLDVGCRSGRLGELLKARQPVEVIGVEMDAQAVETARSRLDRVIAGNIEELDVAFDAGSFDSIICANALERFCDPSRVLERLHGWLSPNGQLIASISNVRHRSVVSSLLDGNWTYGSTTGLLDDTHLHFFTLRGIEALFAASRFKVSQVRIVVDPGYEQVSRQERPGDVLLGRVSLVNVPPKEAREFFVSQYLVDAVRLAKSDGEISSIVVLTHNQLTFTRQCVESVLNWGVTRLPARK